jgi:hypothetical protein
MAHFTDSFSQRSQRNQRRQRSSYPVVGTAFFGQSFSPNAFALQQPAFSSHTMNPTHAPIDTNVGVVSPNSYLAREPGLQRAFNTYPPTYSESRNGSRSEARSAPVFTTRTRPPRTQPASARTISPFVEACRMCYDHLVAEFQTATQNMTSGQTKVRMNPSLNFQFHSERGEQQWQLHTLLYGKKKKGEGSFYKREPTHEEYGILNPFVAIQFQLYQAGLYLTNISDPDKSFSTVFKISRSSPFPSAGGLRNQWHGQHRLMFDPDTDSDFLQKYIEKIYLNDAGSVADFLNTMFAQTRQPDTVVQTIRRTLCPESASAPAPAPASAPASATAVDVSDTEYVESDIGYDDENDEDDAVGGLGRPE